MGCTRGTLGGGFLGVIFLGEFVFLLTSGFAGGESHQSNSFLTELTARSDLFVTNVPHFFGGNFWGEGDFFPNQDGLHERHLGGGIFGGDFFG